MVDATPERPGPRWWLFPACLFVVTRITSGLLLWWVGQSQSPASAIAVEEEVLPVVSDPPSYLNLIANWDGGWYRLIVEQGYPDLLPRVDGSVIQNAWAYYPAYPTLVRGLTELGFSFEVAASVVSIVCGLLATCLLYRMLWETGGALTAVLGVMGLCFFPAAPVLQAAYSESLGLLLILTALWFLRRRRYLLVFLTAVVLSLARPIVLPLAVVVAIHGLDRWRRERADLARKDRLSIAATSVGCAATFALWPGIAGLVTGEPDAYFLTQEAWIQHETDALWPSWVAMSWGNPALLVITSAALVVLVWLVVRRGASNWGVDARAWTLVYGFYIAASTQPTFSVVRYALLAAFPCWPFPEAGRELSIGRRRVMLAAIVVFGLVGQFYWLRWFWVPSPDSIWFP